jgi:hypothetical protein
MAGTKRGTSALLEVATCIKSGKPFPERPEQKIQGERVCREQLAGSDFSLIA